MATGPVNVGQAAREVVEGPMGPAGEKGSRGTGVLKIKSNPAGGTVPGGGSVPEWTIQLDMVLEQAGASEVLIGDTILCGDGYAYAVKSIDGQSITLKDRQKIVGDEGPAGEKGASVLCANRLSAFNDPMDYERDEVPSLKGMTVKWTLEGEIIEQARQRDVLIVTLQPKEISAAPNYVFGTVTGITSSVYGSGFADVTMRVDGYILSGEKGDPDSSGSGADLAKYFAIPGGGEEKGEDSMQTLILHNPGSTEKRVSLDTGSVRRIVTIPPYSSTTVITQNGAFALVNHGGIETKCSPSVTYDRTDANSALYEIDTCGVMCLEYEFSM